MMQVNSFISTDDLKAQFWHIPAQIISSSTAWGGTDPRWFSLPALVLIGSHFIEGHYLSQLFVRQN